MKNTLGCVLAIRDRPPEYLDRALQTFAFQTLQPLDRVLVDFGSQPELSTAYKRLCDDFGWRFLVHSPPPPRWNLSAAYNAAVGALDERVTVVFKSDVDVLLGENVLEAANELGREKLCVFSCLSTVEGATYPARLNSHAELVSMLRDPEPPVMMWGDGLHSFPRKWFQLIGGFDLEYQHWGYEDSDLRERAGWSIGVVSHSTSLLIHQWHPRVLRRDEVARNLAYFERMRSRRELLRNRGVLPSLPSPTPDVDPGHTRGEAFASEYSTRAQRLVFTTRSMNNELFQWSGELLGLARTGHRRHRVLGQDSLSYFQKLLDLDADWVISLDEDVFVLQPEQLHRLVRYMDAKGYAACGMPDGGVVPIRQHNPVACNAFFNVFDLRRLRRLWRDWTTVTRACPRPEHQRFVAEFARRTRSAFDLYEPYYGVFFTLLDAGERILFLDAETWRDGVSTLLNTHDDEPLLLHTWYSREWSRSHHTRARIRRAFEHARQTQNEGLSLSDTPVMANGLTSQQTNSLHKGADSIAR